MSTVKKFPWLSLSLLLVAYSTFGWVLYQITSDWGLCLRNLGRLYIRFNCGWWTFVLAIVFILLLAETLAAPFSNLRKFIVFSLRSDTRAFLALIITTFLLSAIVAWIHVVAQICILITSALLVRLDMMTAGFGEWRAFFTISGVALAGFGLGLLAHKMYLSL